MRGRSSTLTRTSTTRARSVSFSARLALSLAKHDGPSLQSLPMEILLQVLQKATAVTSTATTGMTLHSLCPINDTYSDVLVRAPRLDYRTLRAIALTSRLLASLAHSIMYRSVALDHPKQTSFFARTVLDCAHRDITLTSTLAPVSPVSPTSIAFSYLPTLFAGKFTTRLVLEYPFLDSPRNPRNRGAEMDRFHAATGTLLGFGQSAPSVPSPVLADLRTLVIDTRILEYHLKADHPALSAATSHSMVSPVPSELVLRSYIPRTSSSNSASPRPSLLAPLASQVTHLTIACPSDKWTLPSGTLAALGDVPTLTHLALVRRAHANEANDDEFVSDVSNILSRRAGSLVCVVLAVLPDAGFTTWKREHQERLTDQTLNISDDDSDTCRAVSPDSDLRVLGLYLSTTRIWSQFARLAVDLPVVRVVPGMGDSWTRALRKGRKSSTIFGSNIFHDHGSDIWA